MTALTTRRWVGQAATTLAAWLAAFSVVTALLTVFGHELGGLPPALRALVISGVLVALMVNLVMPAVGATVARMAPDARSSATPARQHARLDALPDWPGRTIAVLSTVGDGPYAIPVSAPVRAGDRRILLSLHRERGSLARLRRRSQVALTLLAEGDIAFTARGPARIVEEPMPDAPDYATVAIDVEHVDDHRQAAFLVESGIDRRWVDESEQRALGGRVAALRELATRD
jgi:hypothetical protein